MAVAAGAGRPPQRQQTGPLLHPICLAVRLTWMAKREMKDNRVEVKLTAASVYPRNILDSTVPR